MTIKQGALIGAAFLWLTTFGTTAQSLVSGGAKGNFKARPVTGSFHSLTLKQPPFPFNPFPELPVTQIEPGVYVYDDRTVDYLALRLEQAELSSLSAMSLSLAEGEGGGGMMMLMGGEGQTNLALTIPIVQGNNVLMSLMNANTNEPYDMFSTTTIGSTNAWKYLGRLPSGTTNFSIALANPGAEAQSVAFNTANTYDSDGDSLSDALENLVTQTDPNNPDDTNSVPPGTIGFELLVDPPPLVRVKHFDQVYRGMQYFSFGTEQGYHGTNQWDRGIGGGGADFQVFQTYPPTTVLVDSVSWDGLGNPTPSTSRRMPPGRWVYHRAKEIYVEPFPEGHTATSILEDNSTTGIELLTGGRALSTAENLVVLTVSVRDQDQWLDGQTSTDIAVVPPEDVTVLGEHPDADERIWKNLADNQKLEVTPVVTASHTNYAFTVSATKLKLKIMRNGEDIAGKKQIVWVGQPINLSCELDNPGFTISNFTWTVPGNTISNYVYSSTYAEVITDYPKTNAAVACYFIDKIDSARLHVTAWVNGFVVSAETTLEVRRPEASFRLTPKWYVEVSSIFSGNYAGIYPRLQTGRKMSTNDVGMMYEFTLNDLKGYQGSYEFEFVQVTSLDQKLNLPYTGTQYISKEVQMRGLDGGYPYAIWGSPNVYGYETDTPATVLVSDLYVFVYREDQFESYLMFRPSGGISVPLRVSNWGWKGKAQFNGINATWSALTPLVNPQGSIATDTISYPTWTNNAANHINFWKYNDFWFTP